MQLKTFIFFDLHTLKLIFASKDWIYEAIAAKLTIFFKKTIAGCLD